MDVDLNLGKTEWHGGKLYRTCPDCYKPVQLNKPLLGSLHLCVTVCEKRGYHSGPFFSKSRVGPFWNRRDDFRCQSCDQVVDVR